MVGFCVGIGTGSAVEERYGIGSSVVVGVQVGTGTGSGVEERWGIGSGLVGDV
ncbi:hypothetical protein ACKI16_45525 [Streptomyces scabiei]|uniref:hypothetical protein n=1 Tax=Streptomyces scabiei TaxID=1930 RepID=UPI0038F751D6